MFAKCILIAVMQRPQLRSVMDVWLIYHRGSDRSINYGNRNTIT